MAVLAEDTLYYRADHPHGFMFSAGNPEPDPADGWVDDPEDIAPLPPQTHECTTLDAFQNLLNSERAAAATTQQNLALRTQQLAAALAIVSERDAQIAELEAQLAAES